MVLPLKTDHNNDKTKKTKKPKLQPSCSSSQTILLKKRIWRIHFSFTGTKYLPRSHLREEVWSMCWEVQFITVVKAWWGPEQLTALMVGAWGCSSISYGVKKQRAGAGTGSGYNPEVLFCGSVCQQGPVSKSLSNLPKTMPPEGDQLADQAHEPMGVMAILYPNIAICLEITPLEYLSKQASKLRE